MLSLKSKFANDFYEYGIVKQGFFRLSSGLLSEYYLQCAKIFENPEFAEMICKFMSQKINDAFGKNHFDVVVSPAMGGLFYGYEMARQLQIRNVFVERKGENNTFVLSRGFEIKNTDNVLVCEDVVTTAKSSIEAINVIKQFSPKSISQTCIFKRGNASDLKNYINGDLVYLEELSIPTFNENNIPNHLIGQTPTKPGSRKS